LGTLNDHRGVHDVLDSLDHAWPSISRCILTGARILRFDSGPGQIEFAQLCSRAPSIQQPRGGTAQCARCAARCGNSHTPSAISPNSTSEAV
jgi:hypothetical protein